MSKMMKKLFSAAMLLCLLALSASAAPKAATLVLLRHGQSQWNLEDRFTGWSDVNLTEAGEKGAYEAGVLMAKEGLCFDAVHVSLLTRAVDTATLAAKGMNAAWLPVQKFWRLNERCYGDLEGKTRKEVTEAVGKDQVKVWRRSYDVPPPALSFDDPRSPVHDPRYAALDRRVIPQAESLKDTIARVGPYWTDALLPELTSGKRMLVVGHSTNLRALSAWIEPGLTPDQLQKLEIPNSTPVVYSLEIDNGTVRVLSRTVLAAPKK